MGSHQKRRSSARAPASDGTGPAARPRWRRLRRWLVAGLLLAAVGVAAAPRIVSRTPLAGLLLGRALPGVGYRIDCRLVSLAWLSGQSLTGVTLSDPTGESLLEIDRVSVDRSLLELLTGRYRQGRVQLDRPVLQVAIRPEGSNVEDFLRGLRQTDWWPSESPDPAAPDRVRNWQLIVTNGQVQDADQTSGAGWTVSGLELELQTALDQAADQGGGLQVTGSGRLLALATDSQSDFQHPGQSTPSSRAVSSGAASAKAAPVEPDGQFKFRLHPGETGRRQLEVVADRLMLSGIAPWLARFVPGIGLTGEVSLDGSLAWWRAPDGPWTWQTSGQLKASRVEYRGESLRGDRLRCERLEGAWQLAGGQGALEIEQLDARTEWGELSARGTFDWPAARSEQRGSPSEQEATDPGGEGSDSAGRIASAVPETHLQARLDVARLAAMLPATLRIRSGVRVKSGTLALKVHRVEETAAIHSAGRHWTARLVLENLAANEGRRQIAWEEPVEATVNFTGSPMDFARLATRISRATLQAPFLRARWEVASRAEGRAATSSPRVDGQFSFDLEQLAAQVGQLVDLSRWQLAGQGRGQFSLQGAAEDRFEVAANLELERLLLKTELLRVDEPQVRLAGDFHWDRRTGQLASQNLECLTSTLAWRGRGLKLDTSESGQPVVAGQVAFRADLRRLAAALRLVTPLAVAAGPADKPVTGQVQFGNEDGRLQARVTLDYDWDSLASFFGPKVRLHGTDRATFLVTGPEHDGKRSGQQPRAWSRRWRVAADVGWQLATVYGLPLGGARWQATLSKGQLRSEPLLVAVGNEGRLTTQPSMRLDPKPPLLTIPPGPLLSEVTLSPEVSENILKYVAPVLAGATRTEGTFSLELDRGQVPLDAPSQADLSGRLAIGRLSVAPGPTTEELVMLVRQIEAIAQRRLPGAVKAADRGLITIEGRTIEFRISRGRVHHRGLEFLVDGVPVRSSGSVGLDHTLDVTIEVPILEKWVRRQRALQSLAGQVLTIPVRGTFQRPRIDQRVVTDLSARMLQGTAERILGDELNQQLEKLFRRK